jgi:hypothetical protein
VKKLILLGAGAVGAASIALFGAGVAAAAPDVAGSTYADAVKTIEDGGGIAKVATRVGDKMNQDECIVTNAWDASFLRDTGGAFGPDKSEVMLALNCAGGYATANNPGPSAASPEAKAVKAAEAEKNAQA